MKISDLKFPIEEIGDVVATYCYGALRIYANNNDVKAAAMIVIRVISIAGIYDTAGTYVRDYKLDPYFALQAVAEKARANASPYLEMTEIPEDFLPDLSDSDKAKVSVRNAKFTYTVGDVDCRVQIALFATEEFQEDFFKFISK